MRRSLWGLVALALVAAVAWALWPRPLVVDVATIGPQDIVVTVEDEGLARIREVFAVSAPVPGRLERSGLHAGDAVVEGETVVARLTPAPPPPIDARARAVAVATRDAAEAALGLAEADLARAEAQATYAAGELDRTGVLVERGAMPAQAMEQARLDSAAARAAVASARASLLVRRRELESAEAVLSERSAGPETGCCVDVPAPASGVVLRVLTESEQVVAAGTPILEIGDPQDLEIVVDLLSADAVRVREGAAATIGGWGGAPIPARVRRIDPSAVTRVSALGIEEARVTSILDLDGEAELRAGLGDGYRVVARIEVWRGDGVAAVPVAALLRSGESWAVFRVEDGLARLTPVEIGERDADWAELRAGVAPGDAVILHPGDQVADGVRVTPRGDPAG